jgi:hypothetical protein
MKRVSFVGQLYQFMLVGRRKGVELDAFVMITWDYNI